MRLIYFFIFTLLFTLETFGQGIIPLELDNRLSSIKLNQNSYSIHIQEVGSDTPIASWNSHKKRSPASVIKLLTTYSGLLELGYDYRWETKFYYTGYIRKGVLKGDLYVKASGDPTLKTEDIAPIVAKIRGAGIKKILGNIILDRTIFKISNRNSSGFDNNIYSPYNAMPDALMFNKRKSTICVTTRGRRVSINKDVPDRSYRVINKLRIVNGSCRRGRSWPRVSIKTDNSGRSTVTLSGKLSRRCGKRTICKVVGRPYRAFYYALKNELERRGVGFKGGLKVKKVPQKAEYLFSHKSDRLEDVISVIAKKSDNLMARQLMLTLGASQYPEPSTPFKSRKAIERILNQYNILEDGTTFIANGSGLSREASLTAQSLANLLEHGALNYGQRWMDTLSIAGVDGTIKRRFRYSSVHGRAWMKTGTIRRVANIAGYVEGYSGKKYIVVVLVNDRKSSKYGRKLANSVIKWVVETL